ncbi:hypothetical protein D4R78_01830 [bacterium]|nr:MAG: hypothetical protein D4R78_01830 [bacterium]
MFFSSYGQIVYDLCATLYNSQDSQLTIVISGNHDLFKFFQLIKTKGLLNAANLIYIETYQLERAKANGVNKILPFVLDLIREKRYMKEVFGKYFANLEGCEVIFYSRGFSGHNCYLLQKLSKKNELIYISHHPFNMSQYSPINVFDLAKLIMLKLTYGYETVMGQYPSKAPYIKGFPFMSNRFISKKVKIVINAREINQIAMNSEPSFSNIFDVSKYSVIYFDDGLLQADYLSVDKDDFKIKLIEMFNILAKYFPQDKIARKYHPGYPGDKTFVKVGDILPDFIPAEFLYNDSVKMYISVLSFSIANLRNSFVVSIVDLINFYDEKAKNSLKKMIMEKSKTEIIFPASLEEFEQIVVDVKGQRI